MSICTEIFSTIGLINVFHLYKCPSCNRRVEAYSFCLIHFIHNGKVKTSIDSLHLTSHRSYSKDVIALKLMIIVIVSIAIHTITLCSIKLVFLWICTHTQKKLLY